MHGGNLPVKARFIILIPGGKKSLDGTDGSIYSKTLEGFAQTVTSLKSHSLAVEELGIDIA